MLSSVLRSKSAIQINIRIMRAFVEARRLAGITTEMGHELAELKARVDLIQLENEQTLGAVNDLSEDVRAEIVASNDTHYDAKMEHHKKRSLEGDLFQTKCSGGFPYGCSIGNSTLPEKEIGSRLRDWTTSEVLPLSKILNV